MIRVTDRAEFKAPTPALRIQWLDGVRALAAIYVMLHHIWLGVYPQFPHDGGPWIVGWLLYGHLGVAVFIVVSGYSLMLQPLRHGGELNNGSKRFFRDRAWRILPPYWVSLGLSVFIVNVITSPRSGGFVGVKGVVVHGLLLQDIIGSTNPNGAFWSIAVECQIYLLFPLLLWLVRRKGVATAAAVTTTLVTVGHLLAARVALFQRINNLTPQLLILFVLGMAAASPSVQSRFAGRSLALSAGLWTVLIATIAALGPVTTVARYFWIDIAAGFVVGVTFIQLTQRPRALPARALSTRPLVEVGHLSYSLYLIHAPVLGIVYDYVVRPSTRTAEAAFLLSLVLAVPACMLSAYCFYRLFERPFLRRRSWQAWKEVLPTRESFSFS